MQTNTKTLLKGPARNIVGGELIPLLFNPIKHLEHLASTYGPFIQFQKGKNTRFLLLDPECLEHILVTNNSNYIKSPRYRKLAPLMGDGLITSDGDFWKSQRKVVQPFFNAEMATRFKTISQVKTEEMVETWKKSCLEGTNIHLWKEMNKVAFAIITQFIFGNDLSKEADRYGIALKKCLAYINWKMESLWEMPTWATFPWDQKFKEHLKVFDELIFQEIDKRKKGTNQSDGAQDFLGYMLMQDGLSQKQLRDQVVTMMLAGFETSATALTWTFVLLAQHPGWQDDLFAEEISGKKSSEDNLALMIFNESLRLYPPGWIFSRESINADQFKSLYIAPKTTINICPYLIHRNRSVWEDPESFLPMRFSKEQSKNRPRCAFVPFSAGPRQCMGAGLSYLEAEVILRKVIGLFKLELPQGQDLKPRPAVVLQPSPEIQLKLSLRRP